MEESNDTPCCWICLSSEGELANVCSCPIDRVAHRKCLARWQLQSAGKAEETRCRFCQAVYPSWKDSLTPVHLQPAVPVVSVHYNGVCYRLRVKPGPEGFASFNRQLQRITGLQALDCMQITFQCRAPESSQELNFKGITAFDAAIHCAAISAAERVAAQKRHAADTFSHCAGASGGPLQTSVASASALGSTSHRSSFIRARSSRQPDAPVQGLRSAGSTPVPTIVSVSPAARGASFDVPSMATNPPHAHYYLTESHSGRLSLDSQLVHRTDPAVVLDRSGVHEVVQLMPQTDRRATKIAQRLRNMFRSLFALD